MIALAPILIAATHAAIHCAYAMSEAVHDAERIAEHQPINHATGLAGRLSVAGIATIAMMMMMWLGSRSWLSVASLVPIGWAAWVIAFRLALNHERGLPPTYVSRSNRYDSVFIAAGEALDVNPGALAYGAEALVLGCGMLMLCL